MRPWKLKVFFWILNDPTSLSLPAFQLSSAVLVISFPPVLLRNMKMFCL